MKFLALKGEVSTNKNIKKQKMLTTFNPGLSRSNVVLNSFHSCVSNTSKELPWTPQMSRSKMVSQPRMLPKKLKGTVSFKQLKDLANTHARRNFNKQVDMVNSDMEFINFKTMSVSNLPYEKLTILLNNQKPERIFRVFRFPDKMECILPKAMAKTSQIHFQTSRDLTISINLFQEGIVYPLHIEEYQELNINGGQQLSFQA